MTQITATQFAIEQGTIAFIIRLYDEDGTLVVPETIQWSLRDLSGSIINDREDVAIGDPGQDNTILLSGADLAIEEAGSYQLPSFVPRHLLVEATYNSTLGAGLPVNCLIEFNIVNLHIGGA